MPAHNPVSGKGVRRRGGEGEGVEGRKIPAQSPR